MIRTLVVLVLASLAAWAATAHSWYPKECCSDKDCSPIDAMRVRVTHSGYMIDEKFHVEFKGAKLSPDEHYHACFSAPSFFGALPTSLGCFWAPRGTG